MTARVIVLVEGQTEEKFAREQLMPELAAEGVFLSATTCGRPRSRAGVPKWTKARRELVRLLKEDRSRRVTTMFDYCGMPLDWPGRKESSGQSHGHRAGIVERRVKAAIAEALPDDLSSNRFIPYVQMYEFEALLFAEPRTLAQVVSRDARPTRVTRELQRIADAFATPEEIDDHPNTAPSKRILHLAPEYQKVTDGNIAAGRIGLWAMRQECPHFNEWLNRLEALGQPQISEKERPA